MPIVLLGALALFAAASNLAGGETTLTVAADGSAQFRTVQAAIDAAPANSDSPVVIEIGPGAYQGHVTIPKNKPFLLFRGTDAAKTILTDDQNLRSTAADGRRLSTSATATVLIEGDDFAAENITFENTTGDRGQALAVCVAADRCCFRNCSFQGWQDTLRLDRGRSYFENCRIAGHVDFIYGDGAAFFERCNLHCLANGYITAASTDKAAAYGFVFRDCRVTADDKARRIYLGRPWGPHASVAFIRTQLPAQVAPAGWHNWGAPENEKTARYAEFRSVGPGANPSARVTWSQQLTEAEASQLTVSAVLAGADGWSPGPERK